MRYSLFPIVKYVRGKITLTWLELCENIARYSAVAVRDDFKMTGQSEIEEVPKSG